MSKNLVIPASVPWSELTGEALEELVYWLLDSMGARDLEWRAGGRGTTAADGGRDLRATFYVPLPDGEIDSQVWWVQAKGTSTTVSKADVIEFLNLGKASPGVDVLVMASNGRFTNPTRDIVREHNAAASPPRLNLWDRDTLIKHLKQHPSVVAQVVPSALSPQGRLRAATTRFWNELTFPSPRDLSGFWETRRELDWTEEDWFAVLVGEAANGSYSQRPWAMVIPVANLVTVFIAGIANMVPLIARAWHGGYTTGPLEEALAYLLLGMVQRYDSDAVMDVLVDPFQFVDLDPEHVSTPKLPDIWHEHLRPPLLGRVQAQLARMCLLDCKRVTADHLLGDQPSQSEFMWRFTVDGQPPADTDGEEQTHPVMEALKEPCRAGLELVEPRGNCPLVAEIPSSPDEIGGFLLDLSRILGVRSRGLFGA